MHHVIPSNQYHLRNQPDVKFTLDFATLRIQESWVTRATIKRNDQVFRYEVVFSGDFIATKENFTAKMYEDTAVSLIRSQLESLRFVDSRITLRAASGLPITQVPATLDWTD